MIRVKKKVYGNHKINSPNDVQVGGNHYIKQGAIQHWDVMGALRADYFTGCATKYIARLESKDDPLTNIAKARHFLAKREQVHGHPGPFYWARVWYRSGYVQQWLTGANMSPIQQACILAMLHYNNDAALGLLAELEHVYKDEYRGADHD